MGLVGILLVVMISNTVQNMVTGITFLIELPMMAGIIYPSFLTNGIRTIPKQESGFSISSVFTSTLRLMCILLDGMMIHPKDRRSRSTHTLWDPNTIIRKIAGGESQK